MFDRRKMCQQCPFNRQGPGGYIGPYDEPEDILQIVDGEQHFPCHEEANDLVHRRCVDAGMDTEDLEEDDRLWDEKIAEEVYATARQCAGAMQWLKTNAHAPRLPAYARAVKRIDIEDTCVRTRNEFLRHHEPARRFKAPKT